MPVKRILTIYGIILSIFVFLIARIGYIQFFSDDSLAESAFEQRLSDTRIERLRGNILDRNGIPFTNRNRNFTAFIKTAYLPKSAIERETVCNALGINAGYLNDLTSKSKPVLIKTDEAGSRAVMAMSTNWVSILNSLDRYDSDTLAKHVIGYLNRKDQIGQSGVEKAYEKELRDRSIFEIGTVTDAAKNPIKGLGYRVKSRNTGNNLNVQLTLDYHIQKIVEEVMDKYGVSGAVVMEDVITGDVLAMASRPDYDQNAIENYLNSSGKELFNKATAAYNLGSVFKIIDAAAYFESPEPIIMNASFRPDPYEKDYYGQDYIGQGYYMPDYNGMYQFDKYSPAGPVNPELYTCEGAVNINGLVFRCSSYFEGGHGEINMEKAFAVSCNSYFIEMSKKIGYKNLVGMAEKFGLGSRTGISGQGIGEAEGSLPSKNSYYSAADIANLSIGQGVLLATPLQVADMVATVANGGIKNRVNIVDSVIDGDGRIVKEVSVREGQRIISKNTADKICDLMEAVTSYGTGTDAIMGYSGGAGGKTGSAETGSSEVVHAWFAGYFPANEPRYSIAVFVENGQLGGKAAGPVFAGIAQKMLEMGY